MIETILIIALCIVVNMGIALFILGKAMGDVLAMIWGDCADWRAKLAFWVALFFWPIVLIWAHYNNRV